MMEERLKERLEANEKILWLGKPGTRKLMDSADKTAQIINWIIFAVFLAVSFAYLLPIFIKNDNSVLAIIALLVCINIIPCIVAFRPMLDKRILDNQTIYAITDKRIIALVKNELFALPNEKGTDCKELNGNLCFGSSDAVSEKKARERAVLGCKKSGQLTGLLFYQVPDSSSILNAIA